MIVSIAFYLETLFLKVIISLYYISNINVILFSINDLKLIKDTPSTRRKLINLEISQLNNDYITYLNYYNKVDMSDRVSCPSLKMVLLDWLTDYVPK